MGVKSGVLVKNENIEKVHFQFLKRILGVRVTTPNCLVYGELGRYPLDINIKLHVSTVMMPTALTGTRIPDPPFTSFGPSRDYGMDLCLELYL